MLIIQLSILLVWCGYRSKDVSRIVVSVMLVMFNSWYQRMTYDSYVHDTRVKV